MYYITLHNFSIYIKVFLLYHKFFQKFFKNFFKKLLTFNSWSYIQIMSKLYKDYSSFDTR